MQVDSASHSSPAFVDCVVGSSEYVKCTPASPPPCLLGIILNAKRNSASGFTLVEILIAITISVIVVGTVYATFFQSSRVTQGIMVQTEVYQMARLCMDRMLKDLNCMYFSPYLIIDENELKTKDEKAYNELIQKYRLIGKDEKDGNTDIDRIYFTTTNDIGLGDLNGLVNEVDYYLREDPDNKGLYLLVRREDNTPHEGPTTRGAEMEIAENVVSMNILYYDKDNKESEEWDATQRLPKPLPYMVKVTIVFKNRNETFTFEGVASPVLAKVQPQEKSGS